MPEIKYFIRLTHYDTGKCEEQEHQTAEAAWEAFRLFAEPASFEIYSRVELVEYNCEESTQYPLAQLTFLA